MDRRQFTAAVTALGLNAAAGAASRVEVETLRLSRNGWMPNNDRLPVLIYRRAFETSSETASTMERIFQRNAWPAQWRNGVYTFHHYHSTAHEVLGFAGGSATVILGGEGGHDVSVQAGDVAVLPTGTGHCLLKASSDFLVVGAYPVDQHWDICRSAPDREAVERMRTLSFPPSDPVSGASGALVNAWRSDQRG